MDHVDRGKSDVIDACLPVPRISTLASLRSLPFFTQPACHTQRSATRAIPDHRPWRGAAGLGDGVQ
jgi:hypothetical protein